MPNSPSPDFRWHGRWRSGRSRSWRRHRTRTSTAKIVKARFSSISAFDRGILPVANDHHRNRRKPPVAVARTRELRRSPPYSYHRYESMMIDRFITLVGRGQENFRSCDHDRTALSSVYRTHRRVPEHGALLCHGNLVVTVWRSLSDTVMGPHRETRSEHEPFFRAGRGCSGSIPRSRSSKTLERISARWYQRSRKPLHRPCKGATSRRKKPAKRPCCKRVMRCRSAKAFSLSGTRNAHSRKKRSENA